jgi:hypothetical protein
VTPVLALVMVIRKEFTIIKAIAAVLQSRPRSHVQISGSSTRLCMLRASSGKQQHNTMCSALLVVRDIQARVLGCCL